MLRERRWLTPRGNESLAGYSQDVKEVVGRWSLSSPLPGRSSRAGKPLGCDGVLTRASQPQPLQATSGAGDYLGPGCGVLKTSWPPTTTTVGMDHREMPLRVVSDCMQVKVPTYPCLRNWI